MGWAEVGTKIVEEGQVEVVGWDGQAKRRWPQARQAVSTVA